MFSRLLGTAFEKLVAFYLQCRFPYATSRSSRMVVAMSSVGVRRMAVVMMMRCICLTERIRRKMNGVERIREIRLRLMVVMVVMRVHVMVVMVRRMAVLRSLCCGLHFWRFSAIHAFILIPRTSTLLCHTAAVSP